MEHIEANVDPDDPNFVQGGGSASGKRNKRGNGGVFSRRRKHISIIDPKEKYINLALKKLITDQEWKNAGVVAQVQMMRNLALQLEEDDKKGGRRRKKKTRRKKKNKR